MFKCRSWLVLCGGALLVPGSALADAGPIEFGGADDPDVAAYGRVPSPEYQIQVDLWTDTLTTPVNVFTDPLFWVPYPLRSRGMPGTLTFDYDLDGDIDIYVTNGPGAPNLLLENQLEETGEATFVDVTAAAGVALTGHDSNGVCGADLDNDGDMEVVVVGRNEASVVFENNGDGTFTDITLSSGVDDGGRTGGSSCQFGDIENDGLLDLLVVRFEDQFDHEACMVPDHPDNQANDLWRNVGDLMFADVSDTSGIRNQSPHPELTHDGGFVDIDEDGDVDIVTLEDQCAATNTGQDPVGGIDRGFPQVFINDGDGNFTNTTETAGTQAFGGWMGLAWADYDFDGTLDFYGTNGGGYAFAPFFPPGAWATEWYTGRIFFGNGDGTFEDRRWPTEPEFNDNSVFGWSAHSEDFDLDGDLDILYFGGIDNVTALDRSNPGTIIVNDGDGTFSHGPTPFQLRHARRNVHGSSTADFDEDGLVDVVSVSNHDAPNFIPLVPYAAVGTSHDSVFDEHATFAPYGTLDEFGNFQWSGFSFPDGTLAVDFNETETSNGHVRIVPMGTVDLTEDGTVNRDGVGSIITVTPRHGQPNKRPTGQSTYLGQDDLAFTAGLGDEHWATVDVFWPGGVRNRLYGVWDGEDIVFPEIPCSYDDPSLSFLQYKRCVRDALEELRDEDVLSYHDAVRFKVSAIIAYLLQQ